MMHDRLFSHGKIPSVDKGIHAPTAVFLAAGRVNVSRRTPSDSNAAESQICGAKPCVPLSAEDKFLAKQIQFKHAEREEL